MTQLLTKEEYLRLINETYKDSIYQDELNELNDDLKDLETENDLSDLKRQMNIEAIDASKLSKKDIKNNILKCNNFKIGKYIIKVMKYNYLNKEISTLDISLWEQANKMVYRVDPHHLDGMEQCSALKYFNDSGVSKNHTAREIPVDDLVYFIKYLQAINNLAAFT